MPRKEDEKVGGGGENRCSQRGRIEKQAKPDSRYKVHPRGFSKKAFEEDHSGKNERWSEIGQGDVILKRT